MLVGFSQLVVSLSLEGPTFCISIKNRNSFKFELPEMRKDLMKQQVIIPSLQYVLQLIIKHKNNLVYCTI